jgi:adenine-specific DNA-methyltransferase
MSNGRKKTSGGQKQVETLTHREAKRKNIPTAELQSAAQRAEELQPFEPVVYQRRHPLPQGAERPRDKDLDPQLAWKGARVHLTVEQLKEVAAKGYVDISDAQLVWRGKDQQDWSDLVVTAPPLYIQEKVHPKAIIDDLARRTKDKREAAAGGMFDLFHDFNGIDPEAKTEFYAHDQNWSNRFILGDSLQVMASLAEREGLRGQVQCIYFDPPYGIKFNSNWQVSTRSRDVKDGKIEEISREPEQVRAFRDTWKDGIHSYLTYLRDRLTAMRDLLTESGSIFVQISDENVHRVRTLLDEVFGEGNFVSQIAFQKTGGFSQSDAPSIADYSLWYCRDRSKIKIRQLYTSLPDPDSDDPNYVFLELADYSWRRMTPEERRREVLLPEHCRIFRFGPTLSEGKSNSPQELKFEGDTFLPGGNSHWKTSIPGMERLGRAGKLLRSGSGVAYRLYWDNFPATGLSNIWLDTQSGGFNEKKVYVVQTTNKVVERCLLMVTDPGDLVLDPTCGSGTTATVAEQWGRRWITIDTSRVALALARTRVMGARYPYYLLADSQEGRLKEGEVTGKPPVTATTHGDIRHGFVYERVPHITLKSIANNAEINVIWEEFQVKLEPLRYNLNAVVGKKWDDWQVPREVESGWSEKAKKAHAEWWEQRIARQKKIDESIAKKADVELLYDRPY